MLDAHKIMFSSFEKADIQININRCAKELNNRIKAPEKKVDESGKALKSKKDLEKDKIHNFYNKLPNHLKIEIINPWT